MPEETTDRISLAAQFVNSTDSHIFLTGKAGTGKTTFLHNLAKATHKNYLIVAPTGIAALNAGGVTIHSQFLFPFGMFNPVESSNNFPLQGPVFTRNTLARKNPLNSLRKQVLRDIDLLVIDEVSMLRADLLDAIDYRLKAVKGDFRRSFGGIQLLMVGDLYQLPPIVKEHDWQILKEHYDSPHFFESQALKNHGFTYIELDKIFRQQDDKFISILNNLRNNECTKDNISELNKRYKKEEEINEEEEIITITTHNYIADQLNQKALRNLPGASYEYHAEIEGNFPENLFPLPQKMQLKVGAQVMFVKNDNLEKRYFNGKLATVSKLDEVRIWVTMAGEKEDYELEAFLWKNIKYSLNEQKDLEEEVIGSFHQFPIKLAWAITVHKSQGLTFEKAIIDVGNAFAPGQVYVALSRLRSLNGLVLRTKIDNSVISSDQEVVRFSNEKNSQPPLNQTLKHQQFQYLKNLLLKSFDFTEIIRQIDYIKNGKAQKIDFEDPEMQQALDKLRQKLVGEEYNTKKFQNQITFLLHKSNQEKLQVRVKKGSNYYLDFLYSCLKNLLLHLEEVKQLSRIKTYKNSLEELDQLLNKKINSLQKTAYITECIFSGKEILNNETLNEEHKNKRTAILQEVFDYIEANPKKISTKTGRKKKKKAREKGETFQTTFKMIKEGFSISEIAKKRALVEGTIEGHLAKGIANGDLDILDFMPEEELSKIESFFSNNADESLSTTYQSADGKYSYGKLRMVQAYLRNKTEIGPEAS